MFNVNITETTQGFRTIKTEKAHQSKLKKSDNYTLFFLLICSIYYIEEQCKMKRDGNFQCDLESKKRVMEAMRDAYAPNIFTYEIDENPKAIIDCRAIGITKDKTIHYAIECKHRNCTADKYDAYYCETGKYQSLNWARLYDNVDRAYIANEFSDGTILLWNIDDLDPNDTEDVRIARTTVGVGEYLSERIMQKRILMKRDKAIKIR